MEHSITKKNEMIGNKKKFLLRKLKNYSKH